MEYIWWIRGEAVGERNREVVEGSGAAEKKEALVQPLRFT